MRWSKLIHLDKFFDSVRNKEFIGLTVVYAFFFYSLSVNTFLKSIMDLVGALGKHK